MVDWGSLCIGKESIGLRRGVLRAGGEGPRPLAYGTPLRVRKELQRLGGSPSPSHGIPLSARKELPRLGVVSRAGRVAFPQPWDSLISLDLLRMAKRSPG